MRRSSQRRHVVVVYALKRFDLEFSCNVPHLKKKPGVCERLKILKLEVSEADSRVASFNPRLFLLFHKEKNSRSRQREVSNLLSVPPCQESITQRSPA